MQQVTGTREAFEQLINTRGIYKHLGVDRSTVANWRKYLSEGKTVSLDKMCEMLTKYGATIAEEIVWNVPMK